MIRTILTFLLIISTCFFAKATAVDSLFIITYTAGPSWDKSKSNGQQAYFKEHSALMNQLRKDGITKIGMYYSEQGVIVIKSASLAKAKEIINADPAVINRTFNADVQKVSVFYEGCLERPK